MVEVVSPLDKLYYKQTAIAPTSYYYPYHPHLPWYSL
jgi:hypothetical protein